MRKTHTKNTLRYYFIVIIALLFLFFSGDFGMIDVQKTAIVMAVGIDRQQDEFIITSQIAIPQSSKQGGESETVQLVSRGKTVADAFEEIDEKTGWYPKLVFCRLIVLGEKTTQNDVFDALGFFLLDEYMSDNCLVATCDGLAKDILNVSALVDKSGSVAIQKILSPHAERVGTVLPSTLREFAIGYYSDSKSGFLPIVKTQPQQEQVGGETQNAGGLGGESQSGSGSQSSSSQGQGQSNGSQDKPVFSANETALFYAGKRVGKLTEAQTFAYNAVKKELRLASYTLQDTDASCTLSIKRNQPKMKVSLGGDNRACVQIQITLTAGLLDYSKALSVEKGTDAGDVPSGVFFSASKLLSSQISETFEVCKNANCDAFGIAERLQKHEKKNYKQVKNDALKNATLEVNVSFTNVR